MEFKYGMRLRGFSIGCQPKEGLLRREDDTTGKYHDVVVYERPLTAKEMSNYDLDRLFTYTDVRRSDQEAFNALPIFFAFGMGQFKEQMEARGLTIADTDKIFRLGDTGGFYLKSDAPVIREYLNRDDPLDVLMKDPAFAKEAFRYEMGNHEYHINWQGDWDVCSCFGKVQYDEEKDFRDYLKELGFDREIIKAYEAARREFLREADEKGWY